MTTLKSALDLLTRIANKDEESIKHLNGMGFPVDTPDLTKEIRAFVNECTARAGSNDVTMTLNIDALPLRKNLSIVQTVFDLAREAVVALEESEAQANGDALLNSWHVDRMSLLIDKLDCLPDDKPGYTLGAVAKAEWALSNQEPDEATRYAESLAVSLSRHFPDCTEWKPLTGDLIGLLTQIDNMSAGLGILLDQSNASLKKAWQENFDLRKAARGVTPETQELRDISKGDCYREPDADFHTAGINVGNHYDRIECNGRTPEIATKLRDEVWDKLTVGGVP